MKRSTCRKLSALTASALVLWFSAVAQLNADEPKAEAAETTLQLEGVIVNLEGAEPEPKTAGLTFTLANAIEGAPRFWLGLSLGGLDETLRLHLGIAPGTGLIVNSVESESPAAKAGVMVNDVLLKLDGKGIATVEALAAQIQEIGAKSAPLELVRRGKPAMLTVSPEQRAAQGLIFNLENVNLQPELTFTTAPILISFEGDGVVVQAEQPDLAKRVGELLEQVKQLQKSLEAVDAAIKAQAGEKK